MTRTAKRYPSACICCRKVHFPITPKSICQACEQSQPQYDAPIRPELAHVPQIPDEFLQRIDQLPPHVEEAVSAVIYQAICPAIRAKDAKERAAWAKPWPAMLHEASDHQDHVTRKAIR